MSGRNPIPREQSYEGVRAVNPPDIIPSKRNPLPSDFKYPLGTMWLNTVTSESFQLVSNPGIWAPLGTAFGGDVNTLTGDNAVAVNPIGGTIFIAGGPNIATSGAGNTITVETVASPTFTDLTLNGNEILVGNLTSTNGNINLVNGTATFNNGDVVVENGNIDVDNGDITVTMGTVTAGTGFTTNTGGFTCTTSGNFQSADGDILMGGIGSVITLTDGGSQYRLHGGAATDFIGTATLTAGTVTIANTNIAAADRIFIQRTGANGSVTLGELTYTIIAATSFTITSLILGTPASPQTADISTLTYFIVRQT